MFEIREAQVEDLPVLLELYLHLHETTVPDPESTAVQAMWRRDVYKRQVYARSGLATKQGIIPANCVGVIDSDYRGEILVTLTTVSYTHLDVYKRQRL